MTNILGQLNDIDGRFADGGRLAYTVYDGSTPLASCDPHGTSVVDVTRPAPPDLPFRWSRFAYARRDGREIVIETPRSAARVTIHDVRVGALMAALAFEATPTVLAARCGLPVATTCSLIGMLQATGIVNPVARERPLSEVVRSIISWSLEEGLPAAWRTDDLERILTTLPLRGDEIADDFTIAWELHHDGTHRCDASIQLRETDQALINYFSHTMGREFDITSARAQDMGVFRLLSDPPAGDDLVSWLDGALEAGGASMRIESNEFVVDLVQLLGTPQWIGFTTVGRDAIRLLFRLESPAQFARVRQILGLAGIDPTVLARLPLIEPLLGGESKVRIAVDAVPDGLGPRVGLEVFDASAWKLVPGVLDALGFSGSAIDEVTDVIDVAPKTRSLELVPGVLTDVQQLRLGHIKIGFEADARATVKSYIFVSNSPRALPGRTSEDSEIPATWEFHDLLFHAQSRDGRRRTPARGTARFGLNPEHNHLSSTPAPGDVVLPAVDISAAVARDAPFGEVVRSRHSERDWSGSELRLADLAELLARVMEVIPRTVQAAGETLEFDGRPYPSGGGLYETDVVVLAHRVEGLTPGAYLYRPGARSLTPLAGDRNRADLLLVGASQGAGNGTERPQALLILAARFPDLAVKYEGLAYALMLKHAGVLMATVHYAATAMGLGAVPLGTGNSEDFAAATGLDYYLHGPIGEIAISTHW